MDQNIYHLYATHKDYDDSIQEYLTITEIEQRITDLMLEGWAIKLTPA